MSDVPMTMAQALGPIPEFVGEQMGESALLRCLEYSGLTVDLLDEQAGYVPEVAINRFLDGASRQSGDDLFGLRVAHLLSVRDYGIWGDYVLAAKTLGEAIQRAIRTIGLHASGDELFVRDGRTTRTLCYRYADRESIGYRQVAVVAAGVTASIPRHYLGEAWRPVSIGLDIGKPAGGHVEDVFGCPIYFDRNAIEIEIEATQFERTNPVRTSSVLTVHDVRRALGNGPPREFPQIVALLVRQALGQENPSLDTIAQALNINRRTLQRRLEASGTNFRCVLSEAKMNRAVELLQDATLSLFDIAVHLDYATTGHFIRAFRTKFEITPSRYRSNNPLPVYGRYAEGRG